MSRYEIRALSSETWAAFVDLCDRHSGGGFGGCWCTWFHPETHSAPGSSAVPRAAGYSRDFKRGPVETGRAHAALVFDDETAVGWAQYGSHRGIARTALDGALELIARAGGGTVETYPQDTAGKKVSASFLYNATRSTFEQAGFIYERPKGKNHCVMRTTVPGPSD